MVWKADVREETARLREKPPEARFKPHERRRKGRRPGHACALAQGEGEAQAISAARRPRGAARMAWQVPPVKKQGVRPPLSAAWGWVAKGRTQAD